MPLKAYEDWRPEPLAFPIGGKVYEVAPLPWESGVRLTEILNGDEITEDAETQNRLLMGDTWDQMRADNVPAEALSRAALTCLVDFRMGRETAEKVWESGLSPEALAPSMGATQTTTQPPSTESENETPSPASTRTTTSRKGSSKKRAAKGSHSQTSSSSGA